MTPGLYNITAKAYHADPCPEASLSNSIIKTLLGKSPWHAWFRHPQLGKQPEPAEDKFDAGTAAHSMLLEGGANITVVYADDWRTKAAKELREEARARGQVALLERHFDTAQTRAGIARAYLRESALGNILSDGMPEQTLLWEEGDIWCRARLDWLTNDRSIILDYKTTELESPAAFCRSHMHAYGYDTQEVFYRRGLRSVAGVVPDFWFLVQEDKAPHTCYLVKAAPSMREVAEHKVGRAIALWSKCLREDTWPGYNKEAYHAEASAWAVTEEEAS